MELAHYLLSAPPENLNPSRISRVSPLSATSIISTGPTSPPWINASKLSIFSKRFCKLGHRAKATPQESEATLAADALTQIKRVLFPITDGNPYLSEGTRQAAATTASLAKKYGADITVVVIDESGKESSPEHENKLSSIRWHLSEGGFQEFGLIERLGEGKKPTAIIGEVADDMNMDIVVMSMEAIHSKHVDANLLAEFIPCPVLLLPL